MYLRPFFVLGGIVMAAAFWLFFLYSSSIAKLANKQNLDKIIVSTGQPVIYPWRRLVLEQKLASPLNSLELEMETGGRDDVVTSDDSRILPQPEDLVSVRLKVDGGRYQIFVPQNILNRVIAPRLSEVVIFSASQSSSSKSFSYAKVQIPFGTLAGVEECWAAMPEKDMEEYGDSAYLYVRNNLNVSIDQNGEASYHFEINCPAAMRPSKMN